MGLEPGCHVRPHQVIDESLARGRHTRRIAPGGLVVADHEPSRLRLIAASDTPSLYSAAARRNPLPMNTDALDILLDDLRTAIV